MDSNHRYECFTLEQSADQTSMPENSSRKARLGEDARLLGGERAMVRHHVHRERVGWDSERLTLRMRTRAALLLGAALATWS